MITAADAMQRRPGTRPRSVVGSPPDLLDEDAGRRDPEERGHRRPPAGEVEDEQAGAHRQQVVAREPHLGHEPAGQTGGGQPDQGDRCEQKIGPARHRAHSDIDQGQDDGAVARDHELGRLGQAGHAEHGPGRELHHPTRLDRAQGVPRSRRVHRREGDDPARPPPRRPGRAIRTVRATPGRPRGPATRGRRANCLHRKAMPNNTPVATHRRRNASASRRGAEPDTDEVLGMKRLDDAVDWQPGSPPARSRAAPRRPRPRPRPSAAAGCTPRPGRPTPGGRARPGTGTSDGWPAGPARTTAGTTASPGAHRASHHVGEPMSGPKGEDEGAR